MQEILKKSLVKYCTGPYRFYRIPGIVVTAAGTVIVYFEMRTGPSDWSTRGIGMFRSEDGGETWTPMQTLVVTDEEVAVNNPVMIACRNGRICLLWEKDYRRGYIQISTDDGKTFAPAVEMTQYMNRFTTECGYRWDVFAFGPGHGIELKNGNLLVPVWLANGGERKHTPSVVSTIVSSDGGRTWEAGEIISGDSTVVSPNETCAVQLDSGEVLLNIRHTGRDTYRAVCRSGDGQHHFTAPVLDRSLPDPICFGSMVRLHRSGSGDAVVFSNCAAHPCRENHFRRLRERLTLRFSPDGGRSWKYSRMVEEVSGYSDVAVSGDNRWIYCFYEHDFDGDLYSQPRYLTFARMNWEWLTDGKCLSPGSRKAEKDAAGLSGMR